jgi:hypothetical protein
MPDLGGIQASQGKRRPHRRALMRTLFYYYDNDRLIVCLDTASIDLMQDFFSDRSTTKALKIECGLSNGYLSGYVNRVGLAEKRRRKTRWRSCCRRSGMTSSLNPTGSRMQGLPTICVSVKAPRRPKMPQKSWPSCSCPTIPPAHWRKRLIFSLIEDRP